MSIEKVRNYFKEKGIADRISFKRNCCSCCQSPALRRKSYCKDIIISHRRKGCANCHCR